MIWSEVDVSYHTVKKTGDTLFLILQKHLLAYLFLLHSAYLSLVNSFTNNEKRSYHLNYHW